MERAHERVGTGKRRREVGECSQRLGPSRRIASGSGGWGSCYTHWTIHNERPTHATASAGYVTFSSAGYVTFLIYFLDEILL